MSKFKDFFLVVKKQSADTFLVQAWTEWERHEDSLKASAFRLKKDELEKALSWLWKGHFDEAGAREFGERLFQVVFTPEIRQFFWKTYHSLNKSEQLRILICFPMDPPFNRLPWELLYTTESNLGFLARSPRLSLARYYMEMPQDERQLQGGSLSVLLVSAQSPGSPPISAGKEIEAVTAPLRKASSLGELVREIWRNLRHVKSFGDVARRIRNRQRFEVQSIPAASFAKFDQTISKAVEDGQPFQVIHFIGHGKADALLFEADPEKNQDGLIAAEKFAESVNRSATLLVVLNACESASGSNFVESTAAALLHKGVPAVLGMQTPVLDQVSVEFGREFYTAWAGGQSLEDAVATARRLSPAKGAAAVTDWGIPTLYLGTHKELVIHPEKSVPLWIRFPLWILQGGWKLVVGLAFLLGIITTYLAIPDLDKQIRMSIEPLRCEIPYPMEGNFNIAFSPFLVEDKNGRFVKDRAGRDLAQKLYTSLESSLRDLDVLGGSVEMRGPNETCGLYGKSTQEIRGSAETLLKEMDADILVYGVLHQGEGPPELELEFQVDSEGFLQNPELGGDYALGSRLPFEPERDPNLSASAISQRALILSQIIKGLTYYNADQFSRALEYFQSASKNPTWWTSDGKELIYLLIGNTYQRRSGCNMKTDDLPGALQAYEQSLAIEPDFLRSQIGRAGALYLLSLNDISKLPGGCPAPGLYQGFVNLEKLNQAAQSFENVRDELLAEPESVESKNALPKVYAGLGYSYLVRFLAGEGEEWLEQSRSMFQEVINLGKDNLVVQFHVGQANGMLGTLAQCDRNQDLALEFYQKAAGRMSPNTNALYYSRIGEISCQKGDLKGATLAYKNAVANCGLAAEAECTVFYADCDGYNTRWKNLLERKNQGKTTCED